jgi:drug/metabolite transporter (DMT)-like permease
MLPPSPWWRAGRGSAGCSWGSSWPLSLAGAWAAKRQRRPSGANSPCSALLWAMPWATSTHGAPRLGWPHHARPVPGHDRLLISAVLVVAFERPWSLAPPSQVLPALLWLGIVGSGLAYVVCFRLIGNWGPTGTSLVSFGIPVVGIVLGVLVLAEAVDGRILEGTAFVVAGIALVNSRRAGRQLHLRSPAPDGVSK